MRFNSIVFIEFLCIFFFGSSLIARKRPVALWYLVIASWIFYGYAAWWFVPVLVGTATVDWALARAMERVPERKKALLVISCVSNIGVLFGFKYLGFFAQTMDGIFGLGLSVPKIVLPIGISFYTFQSMSYVIDVYRGKIEPTKSWLEFLAVVSLFAHLVAGPIVRVSKILPQIQALKKPSPAEMWIGMDLICVGFFKKIVLADRLGGFSDLVYRDPHPGGLAAVLATLAFAFQIYFDFSGYTDIARGLARWLGLDFGLNFNHPYSAIGMADFWSRWHISLTSWVRDYLYIPLGGNREGTAKMYRNIWICMILSGLWHGANWTFVVWGAIHAAFLMLERLTDWPKKLSKTPTGSMLGVALTFLMVCFGWVFFRSESVGQAFGVLRAMVSRPWSLTAETSTDLVALCILMGAIAFELKTVAQRMCLLALRPLPLPALAIRNGVLLALCIVAPGSPRAFIYFQF